MARITGNNNSAFGIWFDTMCIITSRDARLAGRRTRDASRKTFPRPFSNPLKVPLFRRQPTGCPALPALLPTHDRLVSPHHRTSNRQSWQCARIRAGIPRPYRAGPHHRTGSRRVPRAGPLSTRKSVQSSPPSPARQWHDPYPRCLPFPYSYGHRRRSQTCRAS